MPSISMKNGCATVVLMLVVGVIAYFMLTAEGDDGSCDSVRAHSEGQLFVKFVATKQIPNAHVADFDLIHSKQIGKTVYTEYQVDTVNAFGGPVRRYVRGTVQCVRPATEYTKRKWDILSMNIRG